MSGITAPSPELAVHPSRDGGGREPGDELQETGGGTLPETERFPLPAQVHSRRVAGRVAHELSVPARVFPGGRTGNARAGCRPLGPGPGQDVPPAHPALAGPIRCGRTGGAPAGPLDQPQRPCADQVDALTHGAVGRLPGLGPADPSADSG